MLDFDDSRLRAQIVADYEVMAPVITHAGEMDQFVHAVMMNAVQTLRELLNEDNERRAVGRVPPAILALCFGYLSFPERILLSHVCWSWREAALAYPALWCQIKPWSPCRRPELLEMAFSRAGSLPVDIDVHSRAPTAPQALYFSIAQFSHRLRYLSWGSERADLPWDFPAPKLEVFCHDDTLTITDNFFGGHVGRLRSLYLRQVHLPTECSILATVSELSLELTPSDGSAPSSIANLFGLFPCLEFLNIRGITRRASDMLPSGPAPGSLRELWLSTRTADYDLMPHYLAWDSGNLHHVSLDQYDTHPNVQRLAEGTVTLAVTYYANGSSGRTCLTFQKSPSVCHSVTLWRTTASDARAALSAVQPDLCDVRCAMISHVALRRLARVLTALPVLAHLFVHIMPAERRCWSTSMAYTDAFEWGRLSCLAQLARAMPALRAITLHICTGSSYRSGRADADAAQGLLAQLRTLPADEISPIEIQGFDADTVASVDLSGMHVRFDVDAKVGPLVLWRPREAYDPFG